MITVSIQCPFCGKEYEVEVKLEDYWAWQMGELAQNAFPYLSATERESLISGMCPDCQAKFFKEDILDDLDEELADEFDDYGEEEDALFIAHLAGLLPR